MDDTTNSATYTLNFSSTTGNTNVSSWSYLLHGYNSTNPYSTTARWQMPEGTTLNEDTGYSSSSDEMGANTSSDELDNPADAQLYVTSRDSSFNWGAGLARVIILSESDITGTIDLSNMANNRASANITNYMDSIPVLTSANNILDEANIYISHNIPSGTLSSTLSNSFLTFDSEDWESGADVQYKLTNTGGDDSGWLNSNEIQTFTAFTAEPDTLQVKLIPKTTSPTAGTPSIRGVYLTGDKI